MSTRSEYSLAGRHALDVSGGVTAASAGQVTAASAPVTAASPPEAAVEWYRTPVPRARMKALMARRNGPAIVDTLIWLGLMIALAVTATVLWFSWWSVLCLAIYGVLYGSASDSRWHEAGHGTAFRTFWMNTFVYQVASFAMMRNPTAWRWSHTRHHTDTIMVGRDPEIVAMRPPALGRIALNFFGIVDVPTAFAAMARNASGRLGADEATYVPEMERHKVVRTARIWLVIYTATVATCVVTRSILPALLVGLPRMYGAWHHMLCGLMQHAALQENVTDHRLNSRTVYMNRISRFIYWNMNYHAEHHMYPMVPYHRLPELHAELRGDFPPPASGFIDAYREILPVLWRQRHEPEYCVRRELPAPS
jgi:fatty acid desaturase